MNEVEVNYYFERNRNYDVTIETLLRISIDDPLENIYPIRWSTRTRVYTRVQRTRAGDNDRR